MDQQAIERATAHFGQLLAEQQARMQRIRLCRS